MGQRMKYMELKDFVAEGYLHEANRQFFHPLGLALVVGVNDDGEIELAGVKDLRDDQEGVCFNEESLDPGKAKNIEMVKQERFQGRQDALGYWVQPVK